MTTLDLSCRPRHLFLCERTMIRFLVISIALLALAGSVCAAEPKVEFNRDVRPILSDTCFACHGPDKAKRKGDLRLDVADEGKKVVVPGKPEQSELFKRITSHDESERMPPSKAGRQLAKGQIEVLKRWIEQGAEWQPHWAFVAPKVPPLPQVKDSKWPRNGIDHFVLARLQAEGLLPSAEAEKITLIRRVSFDLTGLPPTPKEVDDFLADNSSNAYEKVVDRLLASPRYGERMALDWLDAARYADSNGYQQDRTRTLWPWRDWVIKAFNDNMPYDRFTIEQLAGDLLPNATLDQKVATGFNRNHMLNGEGGRLAEESRVDYVVDRVETTSTVWMGLTLGCARCHDHKYDPFSQKEFYQLYAYFNNISESGSVDRGGNAGPVLKVPSAEQAQRLAKLTAEIADLEMSIKTKPPSPSVADVQRLVLARLLPGASGIALSIPEQALKPTGIQQQIGARRRELDALNKAIPETMVMDERTPPRTSAVLIRGVYDRYGEKVEPAVPGTLPALPKDAPKNRLALARWLVAPDHPLTARVAVNRLWQLYFGLGLVKTTEDFGVQGEQPAHPELLDWLATEFVRLKWDLKAMHRLIVTSATYRQSSRSTPTLRERDPDNRLLARGPRARLSSLTIRDQALFASGLLVEKLGGPPVKPYQPPGIWEEMSFNQIRYVQDKGESLYRRSLYIFWRRTVGPTTLFDTASRQVCTVRPSRTNTPLHALILLNDPTYVEAARALGQRLLLEAKTPDERVILGFRLVTSRRPAEQEQTILKGAVERLLRQYKADPVAAEKLVSIGESPRNSKLDVSELAAYTALASLLLNLDEVITKE